MNMQKTMSKTRTIYQSRALWSTFQHEVYEFKFKQVTYTYCALVNGLIDGVQKLVYERKENSLAALPKISEVIAEERRSKNPRAYA